MDGGWATLVHFWKGESNAHCAKVRRTACDPSQDQGRRDALSASSTADDRLRRISAGPIHVSQLFLDDVYDGIIVPWMLHADAAFAAIAASVGGGLDLG